MQLCSLEVKLVIQIRVVSSQLTFECGVGIAVLVRCFVHKKATESQIADRLGDGFSRPPFATVVVCSFFYVLLQVHIITNYRHVHVVTNSNCLTINQVSRLHLQ